MRQWLYVAIVVNKYINQVVHAAWLLCSMCNEGGVGLGSEDTNPTPPSEEEHGCCVACVMKGALGWDPKIPTQRHLQKRRGSVSVFRRNGKGGRVRDFLARFSTFQLHIYFLASLTQKRCHGSRRSNVTGSGEAGSYKNSAALFNSSYTSK